ncbi:MAG TPA: hypothetical protein VHI13_16640 [Candidatus Kapabacteria bacterium]|nr:hypothetical protein [Candidatus Kapabacteria bacterium]
MRPQRLATHCIDVPGTSRLTAQRVAGIAAFAVLLLFAAGPSPAQAQGDSLVMIPSPDVRPDLWVMLQDSARVYLVVDHDTMDAHGVAPSYMFSMHYDSIETIQYLLTEWRRNQTNLRLPSWIDSRVVNASATMLSFNTTTDTFTCATGDTLSFYRELWWYESMTSDQDTNNYYALDSLDYAMELVRDSDSLRAALIDSIGILPNDHPDRPRIHGTRPLIALVQYQVPAELNGVKTFMRLLLYHRGTGKYWFTRSDHYTMGASNRLQESSSRYYLDLFGQGSTLYRTQLLETLGTRGPESPHLDVAVSVSQPSHATISFASAPDGGATSIAIYDMNGRALFYPFSTPGSSGMQSVEYDFPQGGSYFVGLLHDGRLVAARRISIIR